MRAIIIKNSKAFAFANVDEPRVGPNQVKIRVVAFGVNRTDLEQQNYESFRNSTPGVEFSGHVSDVGERNHKNVPLFEVGDRVAGFVYLGAWAEYVVCDARHLVHLPDMYSMIHAAGMLYSWLSAVDALSDVGAFQKRDKVLVHVAPRSVIGISLAQYAQTMGCRRVYVVNDNESDVDFSRQNLPLKGALPDEVVAINGAKKDWVSIVQKIDPKGIQMIINEGKSHLASDCKILAPGGSLIYIGPRGDAFGNETTSRKGIRVQATNLRIKSPEYIARLFDTFKERFIDRFANRRIKVHVQRAFPWTDVDLAVNQLVNGSGKVVCTINSSNTGQVRLGS